MALTVLQFKNYLKSTRGLTRGREDGLLPDDLLVEAIGNAIKKVARDCDLLPTTKGVPLQAGEWKVPMPEDVNQIIAVWRLDTNGNRIPLTKITQTQFEAGRDPADDLALNPVQYSYPIYEGLPYQWYVKARPNTDYTPVSRITNGSRRTVEDSGANFGHTWDGQRISPGDVVHNISGLSYGKVEVLDLITSKGGGTCDATTSSTQLTVVGVDFDALNVKKHDIICYPDTGVVQAYGFVTAISGDTLTYEDMRGTLSAFANGHIIKVGQAQKIRLSGETPHRGLRDGSRNYFQVLAASATLIGTSFTDTRVTGNGSLTNASVGQEAIAAGGSHGKVEAIGSNYVDVTNWHGGVPINGEVVEIKTADEYEIETEPRLQPVMFLRPTPSTSDPVGEKRLIIHFDIEAFVPTEDWQRIDIPARWEDALKACGEWQVSRLTGTHSVRQVAEYKGVYDNELVEHRNDIHDDPRSEIMTVWGNRFRNANSLGQANQGVNTGHVYDISELLAANED